MIFLRNRDGSYALDMNRPSCEWEKKNTPDAAINSIGGIEG